LINGAIFKNACEIQVCSRKGNWMIILKNWLNGFKYK
jgi:hypothetical protein